MATYQDIYNQVQGFVGDEHSDTLTKIKQWINEGQRDIWVAHEWAFKRITQRLNTVAPYATGTMALAQGSSTITIAGGSLTGLADYKFATAISEPFYRIDTVAADGLSATLESAFAGTTAAASTFIAYKDEYDLGTNAESLESVTLLKSGERGMGFVPLDVIEQYEVTPGSTSVPSAYYLAAPTTRTNNIVLGLRPVSDAIYPLDVRVERKSTDMVSDTDTPSLPDEFVPLIVNFALYRASLYDKSKYVAQVAYADYQRSLSQKIQQVQARTSPSFRFQPFDSGGSRNQDGQFPGPWF